MEKIEINAYFKKGKVIVESKEDVEILSNSGYGIASGESRVLCPYESIFLLSEKRLRVIDEKGMELNQSLLLEAFMNDDPDIWIKYLVYRDLRSRGYVVRDGINLGIDFRVYDRGMYGKQAAKYIVFSVCEGNPIRVQNLVEVSNVVQNIKKQFIVAVADRRGEIVYYSVSKFNIN